MFRRRGVRRVSRDTNSRRLHVEALEDRRLLAGVTVGNALDVVNAPDLSSITALVGNDGGDGISLREAIAATNNTGGADTITFDAAVFTGGANSLIRLGGTELEITESLTIDGSTGVDVVVTADALGNDQLVAGTFITDVAASLSNSATSLDDNSRVLNFSALSGDLELSGLTVAGGRTTGDNLFIGGGQGFETTHSGGGIRFLSIGTLTLTSSTLSGNSTAGFYAKGGGIYARSDTVTLTSSTVSGNSTAGDHADGGGIHALSDTVTLTSSTLSGNSTAGDYADGGGVFTSSDTVTLTSSTVSGNSTTGNSADGGGIYALSVLVTLTSSTLSGNSTAGDFARGGGIGTSNGSVTLTSSTLSGNSTAGDYAGGGGIHDSFGSVTLTSSTVSGNSTAGDHADGGGIHALSDTVTLTSSTLSGNSTAGDDSFGGGIFTSRGSITLTSSTLSDNEAAADGGGIFVYNTSANPAFTIENSIVAGNTDNGGTPNDLVPDPDSVLTINHSLIGVADGLTITGNVGNQTGTAASPLNPLLVPLADNGGPTLTHALLLGSPAIDAGDPSIVFNPAEFDQRGAPFVRVFDDPDVTGSGIDIGAYERQTVANLTLVVSTLSDENDGDYSPSNFSLREAVGLANGSVGADTITFDAAVYTGGANSLIRLGGTELEITELLTIDGSTGEDVVVTADALGDDQLVAGTFITDVAASLTNSVTSLDDNSRVLNFSALSGDLSLSALTVTGGRTTGDNSYLGGGQGFETTHSGGGIRFLSIGTLTLTSSTLSGNSTAGKSADGGGIYTHGGSATLTSSTVSGNSTAGDFADGGGIRMLSGLVTLTSSTLSGNSTAGGGANGGGINTHFGSVTLTSSTLSGNSTTGDFADGGGIHATFGTVTLTSSTLSGNSTTGGGAKGGGINTVGGTVTLTSSTLSGNKAAGAGGGIFVPTSTGVPAFTIENSIVAGNTDNGGMPNDLVPNSGSVLTINHSLIGVADNIVQTITGNVGNQTGTAASPLDPMLGPLADNGGLTQTHDLQAGSPAIDAGDPSVASPPNFDQRGAPFVRVFGGRIDIGAYESQDAPAFPAGDYNHNGIADAADYTVWRDTLGSTTDLRADGSGNNLIDQADYNFWKANFGNTTVPASGTGTGEAASAASVEESERRVGAAPTFEENVIQAFEENVIQVGAAPTLRGGAVVDEAVAFEEDDLLLLAVDAVGVKGDSFEPAVVDEALVEDEAEESGRSLDNSLALALG